MPIFRPETTPPRFGHVERIGRRRGPPTQIRYRVITRSSRELESLGFRVEPRPKYRGVERVLKAIAHERRVIVFDVHVELADVRHEEVHDLAIIGELLTWQYNLIWAFLIELAQRGVRDIATQTTMALSAFKYD